MTPEQFLTQVKLGRLLPVYLFVGPDGYKRDKCRRALIEYWLAEGEEREQGLTRLDLDDTTLAASARPRSSCVRCETLEPTSSGSFPGATRTATG